MLYLGGKRLNEARMVLEWHGLARDLLKLPT
ncbi:MAG: hypothetical protein Nkreftii_000264 [Candidatus Nitrospira kreftii]|uniref:Uncharacterized protein n=1 Tax=Candidatus Nitrospira kreftii TaxID=2652173 RepID=A0A7S8IY14_9BACT|nr:MAG: hypothetical protein Nkreftii_000264 [Candidatus Nitrospira kreftii]